MLNDYKCSRTQVKSAYDPENWTYATSPNSSSNASLSYLQPVPIQLADAFSSDEALLKIPKSKSSPSNLQQLSALPSPFVLKSYDHLPEPLAFKVDLPMTVAISRNCSFYAFFVCRRIFVRRVRRRRCPLTYKTSFTTTRTFPSHSTTRSS